MDYFTFTELERSDTARRFAIDNTIPEAARKNVAALVDRVLDPLRRAWGGPITVTSGYRCPELNKAVGGAAGSLHMQGRAADITVGSPKDNKRLYELAQALNLPLHELIGKKYSYGWLHVAYDPDKPKKQPM